MVAKVAHIWSARVNTPKPPAELTVPKANEIVASYPQDKILQTPITPVTPVTAENLTSLHNLIKQDACTLNGPSKQRIQRHVPVQEQNRFLFKINKEGKVRRSTRSVVLGKSKVISYKDLKEAQAKRTTKEKATTSKGNRGRKRKTTTPEVGSPEPKAKVARISEAPEPEKAPVVYIIET